MQDQPGSRAGLPLFVEVFPFAGFGCGDVFNTRSITRSVDSGRSGLGGFFVEFEVDIDEFLAQLESKPIANHAKNIGFLCITWSTLERAVDDLLFTLMDDRPASILLINCMEFREKLNAVKALWFARGDAEAYDIVEACINRVDNELRPERNRMVHDHWIIEDEQIVRMRKSAQVFRPQARERMLRLRDVKPVTAEEVIRLAAEVMMEAGRLAGLTMLAQGIEPPLPPSSETGG